MQEFAHQMYHEAVDSHARAYPRAVQEGLHGALRFCLFKCKVHPRARQEGLGACFAGMAAREVGAGFA